MRPARGLAPLSAAGLALAAASCGGHPYPELPPAQHVVIVSVDTLRADHLGCYGAASAHTETFDRLAREGVLAEQAVAPAPITLPSHATLLTGLEPWHLGIWHNGLYRLEDRFETLAERLRSEGFETAAFVAGAPLASGSGIEQGFDLFDDAIPDLESAGYEEPSRTAESVTDAAVAWIGSRPGGGRRRFLFVHYYDPHAPYSPPPRYLEDAGGTGGAEGFVAYQGEIAYVDDQLDRLVRALEEHGWLDRTLLVVTADHGEGLMQHGELTHGLFLYDETIRVPLILRYPGLPAGRRIAPVVSLSDVVPTVLEALGLALPEGLDGQSFWRLAQGGNPAREYAFSESRLGSIEYGWAPLRAVRTGEWKFIAAPEPELYDLRRDPGETKNRFETARKTAGWLSEQLERAFARIAPDRPRALDDAELGRLQSLGYFQGGAPGTARPAQGLADPKRMIRVQQQLHIASFEIGQGRYRAAEKRLRELIARDPGNLAARCRLADAWVAMGLLGPAERVLSQALELTKGDPRRSAEVLWRLAGVHRRRGEYDLALRAYEKHDTLVPPSAASIAMRARVLHLAGRTEEALALLEHWLERSPRSTAAWRELARIAEDAGFAGRADEAWRRVLELHPGDTEATRKLARKD
ncbi:MAG: tetratricopeptide repeat protein [Acidobacteria bacterium]|nr:MAG: tetratricopeptide repeat protein [Acidobacteriota bacterium]